MNSGKRMHLEQAVCVAALTVVLVVVVSLMAKRADGQPVTTTTAEATIYDNEKLHGYIAPLTFDTPSTWTRTVTVTLGFNTGPPDWIPYAFTWTGYQDTRRHPENVFPMMGPFRIEIGGE